MSEKKGHIVVEPSMLSADFSNIEAEVRRCIESGADELHLDVMDGHFVRNISFGPAFVEGVRRAADKCKKGVFLDVHLMTYNPARFLREFAKAGANRLTFHYEATHDVKETLQTIRELGVESGLAVNPGTDPTFLFKYIELSDLFLLMTVNPGFGGQQFMPEVLEHIAILRKECDTVMKVLGSPERFFPIQVDGGIDEESAKLCAMNGATHFVSGSYLFKAGNMAEAIMKLRRAGEKTE